MNLTTFSRAMLILKNEKIKNYKVTFKKYLRYKKSFYIIKNILCTPVRIVNEINAIVKQALCLH
jgi:hypothetical protein